MTVKAGASISLNSIKDVTDRVSTAEQSADDAFDAASRASYSATNALASLATVQDVAETLNWITAHGTMTHTSDQHIDPDHIYFIVDPYGDYEVNGAHYSLVTNPTDDDIADYYELTIDQSLNNYVGTHLAVTSEGLWLIPEDNATPQSSGKKMLIATGAGSTYTTAGTYIIEKVSGTDMIMAEFTASGAQIGVDDGAHSVIDTNGQRFYASNGTTQLANIGYGATQGESGQTTAPYYTFGTRTANTTNGDKSVVEGDNNTASGYAAHAEGNGTVASNNRAHAEGQLTTASGASAHAEGNRTTASAYGAHSEGYGGLANNSRNVASGQGAHAEGYIETTASGKGAHAEGWNTIASGGDSHAEGFNTTASGDHSHAGGAGTIASQLAQTAIGIYNVQDTNTGANKKLFIVGNGTSTTPSNAFDIDMLGNVFAAGDITDGSGNVLANKVNGSAGATIGFTLGAWKILWGSESTTTSSASGSGTFAAPYYVDKSITFSFSATPYVWAQVQGSLTGTNFVLVTSTSTSGATLRLMASHKNTTTRYLRWFAIGKA